MNKRSYLPELFLCAILVMAGFSQCQQAAEQQQEAQATDSTTVRFANYNCLLFRPEAGQLLQELQSDTFTQIRAVAEVIQRTAPDVIALLEFDFYEDGQATELFQKNYLDKGWNGAEPINYPYAMAFPSNTGILTGLDLNNNGKLNDAEDAFGYGTHPGQYGFALFSKYPIDTANIRTFQNFLWKDMPNAMLPKFPKSLKSYYSPKALSLFRLSSKNHVDAPIIVDGKTIHALVMHPTPPVFDGPEDRNGTRNHDEIKLFADYLYNDSYLKDDTGKKGGLAEKKAFVLMGDLNADPNDGDSTDDAVMQLLQHPRVNADVALGNKIPYAEGGLENTYSKKRLQSQKGDPRHDTSFYGLRIDYVLPSADLTVESTGIFWPGEQDPFHYLVKDMVSSDHLLVWVNVKI